MRALAAWSFGLLAAWSSQAPGATYAIAEPAYTALFNYSAPCQQAPCATYTTAMAITGSFTVDVPLAPDLPLQDVYPQVTSFQFSDGVNTYRSDDPGVRVSVLMVATDASGAITHHSVVLVKWLSGTVPHASGDRFSALTAVVIPANTLVDAKHNYTCYKTGTAANGVSEICTSASINDSSSSARYEPGVVPTIAKRPVVEYFNAAFGHYFVTADADEITALDQGAFGGAFVRTGRGFHAYEGPAAGTVPVCRFFTTPGTFGARSSHFYTANAAECEGLKSNPNWIYEKIAFHIALLGGDYCTNNTVPVYRMYNHGQTGAPNHRFVTDEAVYTEFVGARGWAAEGIAFCAPFQLY